MTTDRRVTVHPKQGANRKGLLLAGLISALSVAGLLDWEKSGAHSVPQGGAQPVPQGGAQPASVQAPRELRTWGQSDGGSDVLPSYLASPFAAGSNYAALADDSGPLPEQDDAVHSVAALAVPEAPMAESGADHPPAK